MQLRRLELLDADVALLDAHIEEASPRIASRADCSRPSPGARVLAAMLMAELGTDMTIIRSAKHLEAAASACPGSNESAGKQRGTRVRQRDSSLRTAAVEAAVAASRKKFAPPFRSPSCLPLPPA